MTKAREPVSSFSHFIGAVAFAVATVFLIVKTFFDEIGQPEIITGVLIFGLSLVALYSASAIYHFSNGSAKKSLFYASWIIQ